VGKAHFSETLSRVRDGGKRCRPPEAV